MLIKELVVNLENKPGELNRVVSSLAKYDVDLKAVTCIKVNEEKTTIKLIAFGYEEAEKTLKQSGFEYNSNEVVIVDVEDRPGELARVLKIIADAGINIEYVYTTLSYIPSRVLVVFDLNDPERAMEVLKENQIIIVTDHTIMKKSSSGDYYEERDIKEYLTTIITP